MLFGRVQLLLQSGERSLYNFPWWEPSVPCLTACTSLCLSGLPSHSLVFSFGTYGTGLFVGYLTSNGMVKATPPELYSELQQTETGYVFFPVTHLKVE